MNCHVCNQEYVKKNIINYRCPNCTHEYLGWKGDPVEYHKTLFRKDAAHHRTKGEFKQGKVTQNFHNARKDICERRLEEIQDKLRRNDVALDIGSGAGTFASHLCPYIDRVDCLELDPCLIEESIRLGFNTFITDFLSCEINGIYDIVCSWHVLEHVEDIHTFMKKAISLCDAHIFIEVPYQRQIPTKYDGHLHHFTERSFNTFASRLGLSTFKIVQGIQHPSLLLIGER
jgi:hypothetical protein